MMSVWQLGSFIYILEKLGYSANDYKIYFYNLIFMPIMVVSLVFLAGTMTMGLNQNDRFLKVILASLILVFLYYFFSNLMNVLGSTSRINPLLSVITTPILIILISIILLKSRLLNK